MDLTKMNFFKKMNETMPIGLSSLGLKRKKTNKANKTQKIANAYPRFFRFDKVTPIAN